MLHKITLSDKWSKTLSAEPETGMGFQDVEITTMGGKVMDGLVLNGETLETALPITEDQITNIRVKSRQ